ncbi:MAG: NADPH:quinone oxidoreductase family protein [Paracoccaceae bacterium]|nr:NADPH:quinone oxidoreductase family protein [Paracoccaceae bacterium]
MKAMFSNAPGGPETLELTELPTPQPSMNEVLISVKAAGVNFPDTLIIRDLYQIKPPRPFAPGGEVAGIVEAIGAHVTDFAVGERVLAVPGFGGFVSHITVTAEKVIKIPDTMPFEDAACFIFTYGTSHYALRDRGDLKAGETLLISGAAGGVGVAAIEIAKTMGARVIAAVSSQEKADFCRQIGADFAVIYPQKMDRDTQKALSNDVKSIVGANGVDMVYDAVGGDYAEPLVRTMAWNGRFLVVGFPAGIPKIPLNLTLLKSCQIVGVFWGAFTLRDPKQHQVYLAELFDMYKKGQVKPRITETFKLENADKAISYVAERKALGKVVVTMD